MADVRIRLPWTSQILLPGVDEVFLFMRLSMKQKKNSKNSIINLNPPMIWPTLGSNHLTHRLKINLKKIPGIVLKVTVKKSYEKIQDVFTIICLKSHPRNLYCICQVQFWFNLHNLKWSGNFKSTKAKGTQNCIEKLNSLSSLKPT